jgi:hypothetical protein
MESKLKMNFNILYGVVIFETSTFKKLLKSAPSKESEACHHVQKSYVLE